MKEISKTWIIITHGRLLCKRSSKIRSLTSFHKNNHDYNTGINWKFELIFVDNFIPDEINNKMKEHSSW